MVKPKFTADFLEAVVREGADELTLRAEEGTLRTFSLRPRMWETVDGSPLLVDEDWHAICQAILSEWETRRMHQAAKCKKSGENKKAKALWSLKDAKDKRSGFL